MVKVYSLNGLTPVVHPDAYVHPSAVLIGDVLVGPRVYIAPGASLRGDYGRLVLEEGCNIQDNCVMHGYPGTDTVVGRDGHIGHGAVLHGCQLEPDVLVGMNTVIMDGAVIGESSLVAALCFVKAGHEIPPRSLVAGMPGKIMRELTEQEIAWKREGTREYQELAGHCLRGLEETDALTEAEPGRARVELSELLPLHLLRKKEKRAE
ncbi:MAG: phenylacetic acid degradation protein PaaY [Alphaproteobacteria bacterium]|nr:phenylacetic acid degradation protein PaaY [Alphaproteobacteria bacterium]